MRSSRGFTLIELMVTVAIASVAIVGVASVFLSQVRLYQQHESRRSSQSNARGAVAFLEDKLRRAGYGVDPDRAFIAFDSFNAANNLAGTNYPDAIAVHARDSTFSARTITDASSSNLTFTPPLSEPLLAGQILLAVCAGGETHGYAVVLSTTAAGLSSVALRSSAPTESPLGAPGPRFHEQAKFSTRCFDDGTATFVKVDRAAFYVDAFDDDRNTATANVPYLMLHRGVDTNKDNTVDRKDAVPLASGVEQLQFAYILNTINDQPPIVVGVTNAPGYGDAWAASATGPKLEEGFFYNDPTRLVSHPANIRQVRVTVVARGLNREQSRAGDDALTSQAGTTLSNGQVPWKMLENLGTPVGNAAFSPKDGGFARTVLRVSVAPKNLLMRGQFQSPAVGGG